MYTPHHSITQLYLMGKALSVIYEQSFLEYTLNIHFLQNYYKIAISYSNHAIYVQYIFDEMIK